MDTCRSLHMIALWGPKADFSVILRLFNSTVSCWSFRKFYFHKSYNFYIQGLVLRTSVLKYCTLFLCICHWYIRNQAILAARTLVLFCSWFNILQIIFAWLHTRISSGIWTTACFLWLYRCYRYVCDTNTTIHWCRFLKHPAYFTHL
jgi:hypothetical protein